MDADSSVILLGLTLDRESDSLLRRAAALAASAEARLHVVHAIEPPPVSAPNGQWTHLSRRQELEGRQRKVAARIEALGPGSSGRITSEVVARPAHQAITDAGERLNPELVILGANAARRGLSWRLGSTAERVVSKASWPVLVARPGWIWPPARVLLPADLSQEAGEAIVSGLKLLERCRVTGAEKIALVVVSQSGNGDRKAEDDGVAAELRGRLERYLARHVGEATVVEPRVRCGSIAQEILYEVADTAPDLVVVGTHGAGGFERRVLGSVASQLVRNVPVSALVVPPRAAARRQASASQVRS